MLPMLKDVQGALDAGEIKQYGIEQYLISQADPDFSKKIADKKSLSKPEWDAVCVAWEDACNKGVEYRKLIVGPKGQFSEFSTKGSYFHLSPPNLRIENAIGTAKIPVRETRPLPIQGIPTSQNKDVEHACEVFRPWLAVPDETFNDIAYGSTILRGSKKCIESIVTKDGIARSILLLTNSLRSAHELDKWLLLKGKDLHDIVKKSDPYCTLQDTMTFQIGSRLYSRFVFDVGDAMGMNMATQASQEVGSWIQQNAPKEYGVIFETVSANMCVDKKANALDHILGRGKTVSSRVVLSDDDLAPYNTTAQGLFGMVSFSDWLSRGLLASQRCSDALDVVCGFFVHGQDLAQTIESSNCQKYVRLVDKRTIEYMVELPSLEVAAFGGGTTTPSAQECLDAIGCRGKGKAVKLAEIIAGTVLAAQLGHDINIGSQTSYAPETRREMVAVGKPSKRLSGIAQIPVGVAGPFDGYSILLGTTETALVGAVNAGLKAIKDHRSTFDASVRLVEDSPGRGKVFELHSNVTIPSSYFESDAKNRTSAMAISNLVREKCWEGSGKAGGYFGSENTNIANSVAALHVAYGQPLSLIRQNAQGSILCDLEGKDHDLSFSLTLPVLQLKTSGDLPLYAVQALKAVDCYGAGLETEFVKKVYAPVATALELRTTWTQAAGTLARAHTGMTKR